MYKLKLTKFNITKIFIVQRFTDKNSLLVIYLLQ